MSLLCTFSRQRSRSFETTKLYFCPQENACILFIMTPLLQNQALFLEQLGPLLWVLIPLALFDLALKAWGMWRAARMNKNIWFIALLLVNSFGVLPGIFLLMTNSEYKNLKEAA